MLFSQRAPFKVWRSSWGLCTICGQPLDSFSNTISLQNINNNKREGGNVEEVYAKELQPIDFTEEETPVRQVLFRFHMLGILNNSHMVEQYTFLKPYSKDNVAPFDKALKERFTGPKQKKIEEAAYREAYARCMASCAENTIPACRPCNLAMTKQSPQMLVAIRCGKQTQELSWTSLMKHQRVVEDQAQQEEESNQRHVLRKLRKTLQQLALYFDFDGQNWVAKPTRELLTDAYLWRCVVQLGVWCTKEDEFRHRLCANMYLAFLIFFSTTWQQQFDFLDWHIHVFRRFYMNEYPGNTFAGHPCVQLKALFADTWQDPQRWCKFVQDTQLEVTNRLQSRMLQTRDPMQVQALTTRLLQEVNDEQTLLVLLRKLARGEHSAAQQFFHFMEYNVRDSHPKLMRLLSGARAELEVALRPKKGLAISHRLHH